MYNIFYMVNFIKLLVLVFFMISFLSCKNEVEKKVYEADKVIEDQKQEPSIFLDDMKRTEDEETFYRTIAFYGEKVKISIPNDFSEMHETIKSIKYPQNSPDIVYSNKETTVSVAFQLMSKKMFKEDLPKAQQVFAQQLKSTHPDNFDTYIQTINNKQYAIFEFISNAIDTKIYNLMFVTDIDNRLFVGTFNCTENLKDEWESRFKEMLYSLN